MKYAPFFISSNCRGPIIPSLLGVCGAEMNTTSASGRTVSICSGYTIRLTYGLRGMSLGSTPITVMPKACARCAICDPMPPTPTITAVLPRNHVARFVLAFGRNLPNDQQLLSLQARIFSGCDDSSHHATERH